MLKIPFYKPSIGPDEIGEVVDTLKSGWLTTGPKTKQFESEFAKYVCQPHAVALNSCTAALHLALEAIGLKDTQAVVVPTMTFAATAEVVRYFGARPILADCRVDDFNLNVADAEARIDSALASGQEVAAIIPVHYGGQAGDIDGIKKLAQRYNLKVIEDAAHCCPAYYRGISGPRKGGTTDREEAAGGASRHAMAAKDGMPSEDWLPVGTDSDISCYSFYANKTITTGEGGMACTRNEQYANRMRMMALHGISRDAWKRYTSEGSWYYEIVAPGFKYNLTDIASAIGIHQLRRANELHGARTRRAQLYSSHLADVEEIVTPKSHPDRIHSWHLYVIRLRLDRLKIDRAQFIAELKQRGVGTSVHWLPLHLHPYYSITYKYLPEDFPTSAALYPELITLPLYPDMTEGDVGQVCDAVKDIIGLHLKTTHAGFRPPPDPSSKVGTGWMGPASD